MGKKWMLFTLIAFLIGISFGSAFYIWFFYKPSNSNLQTTAKTSTDTSLNVAKKTWDDVAGFSFDYPEDTVIDKHDEDSQNYAHVELSHSSHQGKIVIWAKDLPHDENGNLITTAGGWVESDSDFKNASALDTTLGDQPAKKVLLKKTTAKKYVGTIWDGVLWYVEGDLIDDAYWSGVYDELVTSFTFKPLVKDDVVQSSGAETSSVDEEETLE